MHENFVPESVYPETEVAEVWSISSSGEKMGVRRADGIYCICVYTNLDLTWSANMEHQQYSGLQLLCNILIC
jgi:hypothetical protein